MESLTLSPSSLSIPSSFSPFDRPHAPLDPQPVIFLNPEISTKSGSLSLSIAKKPSSKPTPPLLTPSASTVVTRTKKKIFPDGFFKIRPPMPSHAIDYAKILAFLSNKHSNDMHERHINIILKLTNVYKVSAIPEEHIAPLGNVFALIINKIDLGAEELLEPLEKLVETCIFQASSMHWSIRFLEDLFYVLICPKVRLGCKQSIFDALNLLTIHPHSTILSQAFPMLFDLFSTTSSSLPYLQLFLLCCADPPLKMRLRDFPFSSLLRSLLRSPEHSVYIKVLSMELAWELLFLETEPVEEWVQVLTSVSDLHLLLELLQFLHTLISFPKTPICFPLLDLILDWVTGYELNKTLRCEPPEAFLGFLPGKCIGLALLDVFLQHPSTLSHILNRQYFDFSLGYFTFEPSGRYDQGWTQYELKLLQKHLILQWTRIFGSLKLEYSNPSSLPADTLQVLEGLSCELTLLHFLQEIETKGIEMTLSNQVCLPLDLLEPFLSLILALTQIGPTSLPMKLGQLLLDPLLTLLHRRPAWMTFSAEFQLYLVLHEMGKYQPMLIYHRNVLPLFIEQLAWVHPNPQWQTRMRLAIGATLWQLIQGHALCEAQFLDSYGVFQLLNLLHQESSIRVIGLLLSFLSDLLEFPKTKQHVTHWRSLNGNTHIWNLLLHLWKQQNVQLEFNKSLNAIEELDTNLCCKLFGIFKRIGFDVLSLSLRLEDRCLLLEIERYMDIKIGIVWKEIEYELIREGVRPIAPDREVLKVAHETSLKKKKVIHQLQKQLKLEKKMDQQKKEHVFYQNYLQEQHKEIPIPLQSPLTHFLFTKSHSLDHSRKSPKNVRIQSTTDLEHQHSERLQEKIKTWKLKSLPLHSLCPTLPRSSTLDDTLLQVTEHSAFKISKKSYLNSGTTTGLNLFKRKPTPKSSSKILSSKARSGI